MPFTKDCPDCGEPMVIKQDPDSRTEYLGCSAYPKCEWAEELPTDIRLRRMGSPRLFEV